MEHTLMVVSKGLLAMYHELGITPPPELDAVCQDFGHFYRKRQLAQLGGVSESDVR